MRHEEGLSIPRKINNPISAEQSEINICGKCNVEHERVLSYPDRNKLRKIAVSTMTGSRRMSSAILVFPAPLAREYGKEVIMISLLKCIRSDKIFLHGFVSSKKNIEQFIIT